MALVEVADLTVRIPTVDQGRPAWVHTATSLSLRLRAGGFHALVGESGCGKSMLIATLLGLLPVGTVVTGSVEIEGQQMLTASRQQWQQLRGRTVGYVAQSAATYLTPTRTVGSQLRETIRELEGSRSPEELLEVVHLAPGTLAMYPHELSGGMAQRVGIAFALAGDPKVILADEATASLDRDLTVRVLELLRRCADDGAAVLLVTHDLATLLDTGCADEVSVMYASRILESGPADQVLRAPQHAYTRALLAALPRNGLTTVPGTPPSLTDLDPGHTFEERARQAHQDVAAAMQEATP